MSSTKQPWPFRWDRLFRYRLIEIIAYWEGRLTTKALIEAFGIGRQQASKDINLYIADISSDNLIYDKQLKGYKPTANFEPRLTSGDISEYLQLVSNQQTLNSHFSQLGQASTLILTPPGRNIEPQVIRPIIQAAKESRRVDIRYLSLSSATAKERIISPHNIVFNGQRWHVRAYCEEQKGYRDFVLSRISEVFALEDSSPQTSQQDVAWNKSVNIVIQADPRLSDHQRAIIERDFNMQNHERHFETRAALLTYYLQLLNLDSNALHANPRVQQIVLKNPEELAHWRF